jgi:hypothetical protein
LSRFSYDAAQYSGLSNHVWGSYSAGIFMAFGGRRTSAELMLAVGASQRGQEAACAGCSEVQSTGTAAAGFISAQAFAFEENAII